MWHGYKICHGTLREAGSEGFYLELWTFTLGWFVYVLSLMCGEAFDSDHVIWILLMPLVLLMLSHQSGILMETC